MNDDDKNTSLREGDYVLATKWSDGNPQDHWCVGFYKGKIVGPGQPKHDVVDENNKPFRGNGFRRVKKISKERGQFILENRDNIQKSRRSVWSWLKADINYPPQE